MKKVIALLLLLNMAAVSFSQSQQSAQIRNVSVQEFKKVMDSLPDEIVIDLRTADELKGGKIANARHIDFFGPDFEPAIGRLDKSKTYLVYCASGGRSGETAELMNKMGFKNIYNLEAGFRGWVKEKMPVSR